jgi:hypothetical protein
MLLDSKKVNYDANMLPLRGYFGDECSENESGRTNRF